MPHVALFTQAPVGGLQARKDAACQQVGLEFECRGSK
jgi:hypothetical protein